MLLSNRVPTIFGPLERMNLHNQMTQKMNLIQPSSGNRSAVNGGGKSASYKLIMTVSVFIINVSLALPSWSLSNAFWD